jgi:hypothetical protein
MKLNNSGGHPVKLLRHLAMSFVVLVLAALLAACGGKAVTFAELPIPPEAQPLESGANALADQIAAGLSESLSTASSSAEISVYSLPATSSWEQLKSFYAEQLAGSDWRSDPELSEEGETLSMVFWGRGSFASEQGLAVAYVPPLMGDEPLLMVALVSE